MSRLVGARCRAARLRLSEMVVYNLPFGNHHLIRRYQRGVEMTLEKMTKRPERLKFDGRVLFLTEDVSLVRRQLEAGEDLEFEPERPLMNNISTDEITP